MGKFSRWMPQTICGASRVAKVSGKVGWRRGVVLEGTVDFNAEFREGRREAEGEIYVG
jgi:hypothetical protein